MPWNAITDAVLSGSKRQQEIEVEERSEYQNWRNELGSEIQVFVKRTNRLDINDSDDQYKFYDLTDKFAERIDDLRERSEASKAPTEALIELEELVEFLEDPSAPLAAAVVTFDPSPYEKIRKQKEAERRNQERVEKVQSDLDQVAEKIQAVNQGFETELY